jgi:hypothetical protein
LLDDRPEWREFNDTDDLAKGGPNLARCGIVLVDESKYFGGLQPTCLSGYIFGSAYKTSATTRKRLIRANRRIDNYMERSHAQAIDNAKISCKMAARGLEPGNADSEVRPEFEQLLLQEEEDANRLQQALNASKWSLSRAIRLFGSAHDQETFGDSRQEDASLDDKLDHKLRQCSRDLYHAYSILNAATRKLELPSRVVNDCVDLLCRYAARRDGILVRGVSSTLQLRSKDTTKQCKIQEEHAKNSLRDYNKAKQAGALAAAIIVYYSRRHAHERSIQAICTSIEPPSLENECLDIKGDFIKKKHCSRAMKEVEIFFPDVVQSPATVRLASSNDLQQSVLDNQNVVNVAEHVVRQLGLPPVAEASVRLLCLYWQEKRQSNVKLATLCGSIVYFVCCTGAVMQKLASQATKSKKRRLTYSINDPTETAIVERESEWEQHFLSDNGKVNLESLNSEAKDQRAYEMMRAWDAWQEQMPWSKSIADIERCCGTSSSVLLEFYRQFLHPCRHELLVVLKESVEEARKPPFVQDESATLWHTPMASVLLPQVPVAAALLKVDGVK